MHVRDECDAQWVTAKVGKGITNKQASYLAALQREAGEPWSGSGMSRLQASREIERLRGQLGLEGRPAGAAKAWREGVVTPVVPVPQLSEVLGGRAQGP